jgi:uncharacterized membrane protein YccC
MWQHLHLPRLNYRSLRALRICTVFTFTVGFESILHIPHAGWVAFSVIMIYAGFDNGTTLFRAFHRFWGMLLGLFSGYVLWFIGHLDYRLLFIIIPCTIFLAYYLVGRAHSIPTIFAVNTAVIGNGYFFAHNDYAVTFFITDYAVCTIIGFAIVLCFEYFWFRHYRLMPRFIHDTQQEIIMHLKALINLLNQDKFKHSDFFRRCIEFNNSLANVNNLARNTQFLLSAEAVVGDEFKQFVEQTNRIFIGLKALYSAYYSMRYHPHDYGFLYTQVQTDLAKLEALLRIDITITLQSGAIHEANN